MGLILDSSILIAEERRGHDLRHALSNLCARFAGEEIAVSVITVLELAHGVARSSTPQRRNNHQKFLDDLYSRCRFTPSPFQSHCAQARSMAKIKP